MSGCLEGYNTIARHLLASVNYAALLSKVDTEAGKQCKLLPESRSWVFYSTTSPHPIITMENGKFSKVAAMSIRDGTVAAVGSLEEAEAAVGPLLERRDLKDNVIVPGFVEPHVHVILSAMLKGFLINCDPLNPEIAEDSDGLFAGTMKLIQSKALGLGCNQWLMGYGYDPSRLPLGKQGKFQDLTLDVFDHHGLNHCPMFIINASGHIAYANQRAFEAAGINEETPGPPGGTYVKENGKLTGVLLEPPSYGVFLKKTLPQFMVHSPEIVAGLFKVTKEWSRMGFTTVFDAGVGQITGMDVDALVLAGLSLAAPLRIAGAAANLNAGSAVKIVGDGDMPPGGAPPLNIKTIKLWMDGSTQGFTAALEKKYDTRAMPAYLQYNPYRWARWAVGDAGPVTNAGKLSIKEEMLVWASRGYQLMVHVNGDCATQVVLEAFKEVVKQFPPKAPIIHRLEHFTVTSEEQVAQAKELNLAVSHTIGHVKYWGEVFGDLILPLPGTDRASRIDPVGDDVHHGLVYSFHSDSPVSQADALSYVNTAVNRIKYPTKDSVLGPKQRVSVEAALAGVTINPAKQILLADEIGSLEKGKSADFVILSQDISSPSIDVTAISNEWVQETWLKGVNRYTRSSLDDLAYPLKNGVVVNGTG